MKNLMNRRHWKGAMLLVSATLVSGQSLAAEVNLLRSELVCERSVVTINTAGVQSEIYKFENISDFTGNEKLEVYKDESLPVIQNLKYIGFQREGVNSFTVRSSAHLENVRTNSEGQFSLSMSAAHDSQNSARRVSFEKSEPALNEKLEGFMTVGQLNGEAVQIHAVCNFSNPKIESAKEIK